MMRSTPSPGLLSSSGSLRSLHLVDIENLVGNPRASAGGIRRGMAAYLRAAAVAPHDLVVVAMNCGLFKHTAFVLDGGWKLRAAHGPDGADLALLEEAPASWTVSRFDRLVIGSGDGIFAERAAEVRAAGRVVWAVSPPASLSRRLARSVDHVRPFVDLRLVPAETVPPAGSPTSRLEPQAQPLTAA